MKINRIECIKSKAKMSYVTSSNVKTFSLLNLFSSSLAFFCSLPDLGFFFAAFAEFASAFVCLEGDVSVPSVFCCFFRPFISGGGGEAPFVWGTEQKWREFRMFPLFNQRNERKRNSLAVLAKSFFPLLSSQVPYSQLKRKQ